MSAGIVFNFDQTDVDQTDVMIPMEMSEEEEEPQKIIRETRDVMTKYEITRTIGARATLLANGATPLVNVEGEKDLLKIAEKELRAKLLPIIIVRILPNGHKEEWPIQDLRIL